MQVLSSRIKRFLPQLKYVFITRKTDNSWVLDISLIILLKPGDCMQVFLYVRVWESVGGSAVPPRLTESGALWENRRLLSSFMVYSTLSLLYRSFPPSLPHTWPHPHTTTVMCVSVWERYNSVFFHLLHAGCHLPHRNSFSLNKIALSDVQA